MSDERLKLRGRLADAEKVAEASKKSIGFTIDKIRCYADKYENIAALKTGIILEEAQRLDKEKAVYIAANELVTSLKRDLGEA